MKKQFTMKMSDETKKRLQTLSNNEKHRYCLSSVIRELINNAYQDYASK